MQIYFEIDAVKSVQSLRGLSWMLLRNSGLVQVTADEYQLISNEYIARTLLEGLLALGDHLQALKRKEQDMLAEKKIPDGQNEEMSQDEYKRGISGWNVNLEDVKAQASLIQDEDTQSDKDQGGSLVTASGLDQEKKFQHQLSSVSSSVSHRLQVSDPVITQHPSFSHPPPSPSDPTPPKLVGHTLFLMVQSVLHTNMHQRTDCAVDGGGLPMNTSVAEKSLLEAAHDREKELLREITDLQLRLICAQEELQKYKTENA
ncbi:hypothetical protein C3L33_17194, partial [Rhododendron williamsianum]